MARVIGEKLLSNDFRQLSTSTWVFARSTRKRNEASRARILLASSIFLVSGISWNLHLASWETKAITAKSSRLKSKSWNQRWIPEWTAKIWLHLNQKRKRI
jgi:hypothetical protein